MKKNGNIKIIIIGLIIIIVLLSICLAVFITFNKDKNTGVTNSDYSSSKLENKENDVDNENSENYTKQVGDLSITIPKGFNIVDTNSNDEIILDVSKYEEYLTRENIDNGIVIKDSNENEFVWIPIKDISDICLKDESGYNSGKLYEFTNYIVENGTIDDAIKQNLVTYDEGLDIRYNESTLLKIEPYNFEIMNNKEILTTSYEPNISDNCIRNNITKEVLQKEFDDMIKSVEKYKGFYIGRYETGNMSKEKYVINKNNLDLGNQDWYQMHSKSKDILDSDSVATNMIWGCQWDATMMFVLKSGEKKNVIGVPEYGNVKETNKKEGKIEPTGSNDNTKTNNIYDLLGNVYEWTLEMGNFNSFASRSSSYQTSIDIDSAGSRRTFTPVQVNDQIGCRISMYIKN